MKIDHRKKYICVLDTETANTFRNENNELDTSSALVYDLGYKIIDKQGNTYLRRSYVIADVFLGMPEVMATAYYIDKKPIYLKDIKNGKRKYITFEHARNVLFSDLKKYNVSVVCAHNARFDYNSLNSTIRYLTKSKNRYFLPYNIEIWDSLKMAQSIFSNRKTYISFCQENGYMTTHKTPRPRFTAEILYRFISKNNNFIENHTGLEDVEIESEIVVACLRAKKKMNKKLW